MTDPSRCEIGNAANRPRAPSGVMAGACQRRGIDTRRLLTVTDTGTAWTDVMSVTASGRHDYRGGPCQP